MDIFKKYKMVWIIFLVVVVLVSAGITLVVKAIINGGFVMDSYSQLASVEIKTGSRWSKSFSYFNGYQNKKIKLDAGEEITFNCSSEITKGSLDISFVNSKLEELQKLPVNADGICTYKAQEDGSYYIRVDGDDAKGKFDLRWLLK